MPVAPLRYIEATCWSGGMMQIRCMTLRLYTRYNPVSHLEESMMTGFALRGLENQQQSFYHFL
ncbi:MAG: hypothetical protein PHD43_06955 [Methylococcales bacterium]|nr:hypothetical protein [Methylococcales bacterium]